MESVEVAMDVSEKSYSLSEWVLTYDFGILLSLLDLLEPHLVASFEEFEMDLTVMSAMEEDKALKASLYSLANDEEERGEQSRNILFRSLFAASYAVFEHKMTLISNRVQGEANNPFSVADMRSRSLLDRAKRYLETLGVDFPALGSDWKEITTFQQIRNKIMPRGRVCRKKP